MIIRGVNSSIYTSAVTAEALKNSQNIKSIGEQFGVGNSKKISDEKLSNMMNSASIEASKEAAILRPQYLKHAPVSPSEKSDKSYFNSAIYGGDLNVVEEAEYSVEDENGFPSDYEFPKNNFAPKGFFITLSKEHLSSSFGKRELTPADRLKQKFYATDFRKGSLINLTM